jgi:hypothetical protein
VNGKNAQCVRLRSQLRPGFGDLPVSCADSGMPAGMKAITGARRVGGKAEVTPNAEQLTPSKLLMATYCSYVEC